MAITQNKKRRGYLGSSKLKRAGVQVELTQEQIDEYIKCANNPTYFINKYLRIITLDRGFVNIDLYPYQIEAINDINENQKVIIKAGRQVGKTSLVVGYICWYILFNEAKTIAILANKAKTAREILNRLKIAYEDVPQWMQQGVEIWNKGDIGLENQSRVLADSTASSAIRGWSINCVTKDTKICVSDDNENVYYTEIEKILNNEGRFFQVRDEMKFQYLVYKVTNNVNGKIYVGFHKTTDINDGYMGSGKLIKRAIKKYGIENFTKEILESFEDKESAEAYEAKVVDRDFSMREDTYNICTGGDVRIMWGENNPFFGKNHSEEARKKMSASRTGMRLGYDKKTSSNLHVDGVYYPNLAAASRILEISRNDILNLVSENRVVFSDQNIQESAIKRLKKIDDNKIINRQEKSKRFLGRTLSDDHRRKISEGLLGVKKTIEHVEKINKNPEKIKKTAEKHKGMKRSDEAKLNMSLSKKGRPSQNKGKTYCYDPSTPTSKHLICDPANIPEGYVKGFRK